MSSERSILAIWNDIKAGAEAAFIEWHSREHMPERLAIAGFRRGRRMFADDARPRWLTLYEADSASVFQSPAYLERLANPTPGTRAVLTSFLATERMIGEVVAEAGRGAGGALACLRLWSGEEIDDGRLDELVRTVSDHAPALSCLALRNIGLIQRTEEQKLRGGDLDAPDLVVLAELYARGPNRWQAPAAFAEIADHFARARTDIYLPECELPG